MKNFYKKAALFFFLAFTLSQTICAQNFAIKKDKSYGGSRDDNATSIMAVENGNYIIAGQTISNDGQVTGFRGGLGFYSDFWIIKTNSAGKLLWQKTLGGVKEDVPFDMVKSADGGYVIAGTTGSIDGDVTNNHGQADFWIVKLNTAGILVWQHTYGGIRTDAAHSIIATINGGFLITGTYTISNGTTDAWVIKINSAGTMLWQKFYGNIFSDEAYSIAPAADGGFIIAGTTKGIDGNLEEYNGLTDYMVVKADMNGNVQWQKAYGGTMRDEGHTVYQTADGGYIVGGFTESTDGQVTNNHGMRDIWILKINNTGVLQWQKTLGGSNTDWMFDVIPATDGGIIVTGDVASTDGDITGNHSTDGMSDMWVSKLDNSGSLLSSISLGGSSSDGARSIIPVTDGYIVAGYAYSNDGDVSKYLGGGDFWSVRLDQTLSQKSVIAANITKGTNNQLKIHPNPSAGDFTITLPDDIKKDITIRISTQTSKLIYQNKYNVTGSILTIFLNAKIENGIYNLTVLSGRNVLQQKLIIQQ